ncbi:uncharacterized protein LOC118448292 [Vespa mandarinia]|uniref:uncharacterized protein LOC118448292 n=1 Tax=Vespa mandarinia TaxID=7446 RepID=UPI001610CFBC|nr:uncharacterized protein LOC118448292 [Vespa mandarinia]
MNAWKHCTPFKYEYVIKDAYNIKIIKILENSTKIERHKTTIRPLISNNSGQRDPTILQKLTELLVKTTLISTEDENNSSNDDLNKKIFSTQSYVEEAVKRNIGVQLKVYLINTVAEQVKLYEFELNQTNFTYSLS